MYKKKGTCIEMYKEVFKLLWQSFEAIL